MGWEFINDLANENAPSLPTKSGLFYSSPNITNLGTLTIAINKLYAIPILITDAAQATSINIEITSQALNQRARLGIYYDGGGVPGNLLLDAGLISETGTGNKPITLSLNLPAGWYWLALASTGTPTVRANTQTAAFTILGFTSGTDTTTHVGYTADFPTFGTGIALPNPFTPGGVLASGSMPRLMIGI